MATFLMTLLLFAGLFLILVVLLQRGRGGGLAGAFGGQGGQSVLGVKAGDIFTKITCGVAVAWVLLAGFSGMAMRSSEKRFQETTVAPADEGIEADGDEADIPEADAEDPETKPADADDTGSDSGTPGDTTPADSSSTGDDAKGADSTDDAQPGSGEASTEPPAEAPADPAAPSDAPATSSDETAKPADPVDN